MFVVTVVVVVVDSILLIVVLGVVAADVPRVVEVVELAAMGVVSIVVRFVLAVSVVVGCFVVVVTGFGIRDSTTPIGPFRSTSDSGQVSSSGCIA